MMLNLWGEQSVSAVDKVSVEVAGEGGSGRNSEGEKIE